MRILAAENFLTADRPFHVARHRQFMAGEHGHARFLEFFYTLGGRGRHQVNGVEHAVARGVLVLVREGDTHAMQGAGVEHINVAFRREMAEQAARFLNASHWLLRLNEPGPPLTATLRGRGRTEFERRLQTACEQFPGQDLLLRGLLLEVLQRVLFTPAPAPVAGSSAATPALAPAVPDWLEDLCRQLQRPEGFLQPVTALPARAGKTAEHLARSFRKYLHTTPTDYLNARRLDLAARYLSTTEKKILAIAYECGFLQPGYFYRLFLRRFGRTPRRYRRLGQQVLDPTAG